MAQTVGPDPMCSPDPLPPTPPLRITAAGVCCYRRRDYRGIRCHLRYRIRCRTGVLLRQLDVRDRFLWVRHWQGL
jgi:hypothetical protein